MSSHHFVKEDQEPAIYITSIKAVDDKVLSGLLEWAPLVIASSNELKGLIEQHVKVDLVIARENEDLEKFREQVEFEILVSQYNKELPILKEYLVGHGQNYLNIIGGYEKYDPRQVKQASKGVNLCFYYDQWKCFPIQKFEKWFPGGEKIKLMAQIDANLLLNKVPLQLVKGQQFEHYHPKDGVVKLEVLNGLVMMEESLI